MTNAIGGDLLERPAKLGELPRAPDERRVQTPREARRTGVDRDQPVRGHARGLSLQLERLDGLGDHGVANEPERRLGEQHLPDGGGLLQAGGDVHRIARDERLPNARVPGHDLTGVDADPAREGRAVVALELFVQQTEALPHLVRGPDRAERVVLVGRRDPEDRHDGVADELLHDATVAFDRLRHRREVPAHHAAERFRVQPLPERGRSRDVAEDDRDGLAHLGGRSRRRQALAAGVAEPRAGGVIRTTGRTGRHDKRSLRRAAPGRGRQTAS